MTSSCAVGQKIDTVANLNVENSASNEHREAFDAATIWTHHFPHIEATQKAMAFGVLIGTDLWDEVQPPSHSCC